MLPRATVGKLAVTVMSYGFKHGTPRDADLNFDVRFLPNPHYESELRPSHRARTRRSASTSRTPTA